MFTLRENMLLFTKRMRKYELEPTLVSVAEKRQPPHVILSIAKNLSHIEILCYAQDDKTGFRNRDILAVTMH
jgi:hypothetical protein